MTTRAFQKVYTKIDNITKATITLRATADKIILGGMGLTNDDFL